MGWSIAEVARMSGVTSRTLRHYDAVGLVPPARVAANGHRHYEQEQLLRLQRVLLLRELGLGLAAIAEVLSGTCDQVTALQRHQRWLDDERARLARLSDTVSRTIQQLRGEEQMSAAELFDGFADQRARLEEDLVREHGEGVRENFREAERLAEGFTRDDHLAAQRRAEEVEDAVLAVLRSGAAPGSDEALAAMADHHAMVSQFWTPDAAAYTGLGQLYVDDPDFRARYDAKDPRLAEYLRDAAAAYAVRHLD